MLRPFLGTPGHATGRQDVRDPWWRKRLITATFTLLCGQIFCLSQFSPHHEKTKHNFSLAPSPSLPSCPSKPSLSRSCLSYIFTFSSLFCISFLFLLSSHFVCLILAHILALLLFFLFPVLTFLFCHFLFHFSLFLSAPSLPYFFAFFLPFPSPGSFSSLLTFIYLEGKCYCYGADAQHE